MATAETPLPTPAETLAWEDANRGKASTAAWCAAALTLGGAVLTGVAFNNLPDYDDKVVTIGDALRDLATGAPIPAGRAVLQLQYIADHPGPFIAGPLLSAFGALFLYVVFAFLFRAVKARKPEFSKVAIISAAIGAVSYAVGSALVGILRVIEARDLAPGATNSDALDAVASGPIAIATVLQLLGSLALGFTFVIIGLNAMRVGLLTRFMGVLGVIVGATFVLPLDQQGIIRSFWVGAIGFLIARKWPRGVPPAWDSGEAEPWPSAAVVREQRAAAEGPSVPPAAPAPAPPSPDGLTAGQRRKKRKKK